MPNDQDTTPERFEARMSQLLCRAEDDPQGARQEAMDEIFRLLQSLGYDGAATQTMRQMHLG